MIFLKYPFWHYFLPNIKFIVESRMENLITQIPVEAVLKEMVLDGAKGIADGTNKSVA